MSGTFSSFGSALSALRYNRVAMDVASNNVANANTEGYVRRSALAQATGAPPVQALWSTWNGTAGGVEVGGIERMVDPLLDARSRLEHASLSQLGVRSASLVRFETTIGEPSDNGIAAALSAFKRGCHDVANAPDDDAARSQLLGRAQTLESAIRAQATAVSTEWSDQRMRLTSVQAEVNKLASDLADLNGALLAAQTTDGDASTLLDQRDVLALRLSELTGGHVSVHRNGDGTATSMFDVTVGGQPLVTGTTARAMVITGPQSMGDSGPELGVWVLDAPVPDPLPDPVPPTAAANPTLVGGELGGTLRVMQEDLPAYLGDLDTFALTLRDAVNAIHTTGFDSSGAAGGAFFTGDTAATFTLNLTAPGQVAAADAAGTLDGSVAMAIGEADLGAAEYRSLVSRFGVEVASARRLTENQRVLTAQVDANRESLAGVSIDEEMVNLLAAQRAYEGASRVITTLDSVLDTLINRTGLTR